MVNDRFWRALLYVSGTVHSHQHSHPRFPGANPQRVGLGLFLLLTCPRLLLGRYQPDRRPFLLCIYLPSMSVHGLDPNRVSTAAVSSNFPGGHIATSTCSQCGELIPDLSEIFPRKRKPLGKVTQQLLHLWSSFSKSVFAVESHRSNCKILLPGAAGSVSECSVREPPTQTNSSMIPWLFCLNIVAIIIRRQLSMRYFLGPLAPT